MFYIKKCSLFIFVLFLFCPILCFSVESCDEKGVCEAAILSGSPVKSSEIPDKREFPVNETVNPCKNFYNYACSPVISTFKLREDRSIHVFAFSDSRERLLKSKKDYFAGLAKRDPESEVEGELKDNYMACMNTEAMKKEEVQIVKETKERLESIKTREGLLSFLAGNIKDVSKLSFISLQAGLPNLDRPEYGDVIFDFDLSSLPEKSYYDKEEVTDDLKVIIEYFFVAIGMDFPRERAELVYNFEKGLAQVYPTPPEVEERVFTKTEITRKELIEDYRSLKLKGILDDIPGHVFIRDIVGKDAMVFVDEKLATATLLELKSVYLYFKLKGILDEAYPEFFNKRFEFRKKHLGGPNERSELHERCVRNVEDSFEKELGFILLPKLFPDFPKEKFVKSIEKIRVSLIDKLEQNMWLSESAKSEAIRKMKKAKLALVSPNNEEEWYFNPRGSYSPDAPIANSYKLAQMLFDRSLQELEGPVNTNRWHSSPIIVNASYNPFYNKFVLPVGILQYPFYDISAPLEVNFGAIGVVIGHELGHGIDNHGNGFDADGVYRPWMLPEDREAFDNRTHYLINQFNNIGHNGEFTLGENIGDLVGMTTAYSAAFPEGVERNKDLERRFFLQHARVWCSVAREGFEDMLLKIDPHSLPYARVNEQVKHQIGFKKAYDCKPEDPLVIPEKEIVKIW